MKLLSKPELKKTVQAEDEEFVVASYEVVNARISAEQELNDFKAFIASEKKRINDKMASDFAMLENKRAVLAKEVQELEAKRAEVLKPFEDKIAHANAEEKRVNDLSITFQERYDKLQVSERDHANAEQSLKERTEKVSDREERAKVRDEKSFANQESAKAFFEKTVQDAKRIRKECDENQAVIDQGFKKLAEETALVMAKRAHLMTIKEETERLKEKMKEEKENAVKEWLSKNLLKV